jgi:magnesium transporter
MVRTILYSLATGKIQSGNEELLAVWQRESDTIIWADFSDNDAETEKQTLITCFGLHPMAIKDAQRLRHPPKIETFLDNVLILLKGLGTQSDEFEFGTIQLALFIGQRFLVTRHSGSSRSIDELREWPARAFYTNVIESVTVRRPFNKGLWIVHRWLSCWGF